MSCTRKRSISQINSLANPDVVSEETGPKSGKWSAEEEMYANKLIAQFETGTLTDCAEGSTLRSYLARKLNCAPMRISKKFAGQCIGKHTFTKKEPCVTPATDRDSLSEASTLTSSPALNEDPLDFMSGKVINIMSFDTFTEFQGRQDANTFSSFAPARGVVAFPVPEKGRAGMNIWSTPVERIPQSNVYPPQKRQLITAFPDSAFESPCRAGDVGLDLDNMYSSCDAAKVTPFEYARMTPPPAGPAFELSEKKDWGLKCTIPHYQYRPQSPSTVIPSGAAVVTPTPSSTAPDCQPAPVSAFVPCPPQQQYEQCKQFDAYPQYDYCDPADIEAAEWRDVLDYFCGPQAQYF